MSVRELLARIGADELTEWMAFFSLEPWGCEVEDLRAAMTPATVINALRGKHQKAVSPLDLIPDRGGLRKKQKTVSGADFARALEAWTVGLGGEVRRG